MAIDTTDTPEIPEANFDVAARPARARSTFYFIWRALISDRYALIGTLIVGTFVLAAIFAPWIAPYGPEEADPVLRLQGSSSTASRRPSDASSAWAWRRRDRRPRSSPGPRGVPGS